MRAYNLKTNRLTCPMGIDAGTVLLSWVAEGGIKQTAFRIKLTTRNGLLHDSGVVPSGEMQYCPDITVKSKEHVTWSVSLCDETGHWGEEVCSHFETTISKEEWTAKWINPEPVEPPYCRVAMDGFPLNKASYLKKEFTVDELGSARLYATAHGVYNVWINDVEVEGYFMAPGSSDYEKRLQVQTYDVSVLLKQGKNEIMVTIGDGWWRGSVGWDMTRYCFGTDLGLLCQLEIDGCPVVVTDETWQASQNGPLQENDTMRLERYDAGKEISDWHEVRVEDHGYGNLIGIELPITAHERFKAKLFTAPNGQKILDFGQNFAGYVELDFMASGGETIRLTHGEVLDKYGNFQNDNFQNPDSPICRQVIEYTCKPGRNQYHQTKCYYGFRYVLIETDLPITGEEFTGVAVYSDMAQTGFFECGISEVNRFFENVIWSMKSNFVDVPTDCPHREKLGFTGDAQVFTSAALYLMDAYPVIRRWLRESVSCQDPTGCILYIAPPFTGPQSEPRFKDGSAGWSNSMTIVPYGFLRHLNSVEEIREYYPAIQKWIAYNLGRAKQSRPENEALPAHIRNYILDTANNWGEWCEPGRGPEDYALEGEQTGHAEIATAFLAYDCYLTWQMAKRLGETADAAYYKDLYEKTKAAYRYVFTKDGAISSDRQCHYIRPVAHQLLDGSENDRAAEQLAELVRQNGNKIGTGFLTTCHLCEVLTDYGYASVAYDLLLQREQPSWLFEVEHGATTVWESWFGITKEQDVTGSHNHYSLGAVAGWMISRALGITAYDGKVVLRPYPDKRLGYAKGSYLSPLGKIASSWTYEGDTIRFAFEVPANTEATVILPDGRQEQVGPGTHTYAVAQ